MGKKNRHNRNNNGGYNISQNNNSDVVVRTVQTANGLTKQVKFPKENKILTRDKFILHDVAIIENGLIVAYDDYDMIDEVGKKMSFHRPDVKAFTDTHEYAPQINWKKLGIAGFKENSDLIVVIESIDRQAIADFVYNLNKYADQTGLSFDIEEAMVFFSSYQVIDIHAFLDYLNYLDFEKVPAYIRKQTFMKPENSLLSGVWTSDTPVWVVDLPPSRLPKEKKGVYYYDDKTKITGVRGANQKW